MVNQNPEQIARDEIDALLEKAGWSAQDKKKIIDLVEYQLQKSDKAIADIKEQLAKAETLHQTILKKAFSGKFVSNFSNQEIQ